MPNFGDFSTHRDPFMKEEGPPAIKVINNTPGGWDAIRNFRGESFMWHATPEIERMMNQMPSSHSGASMGFLMRHMQVIACDGWDQYCVKFC
jgi:hypothetical protein